MIAKSRLFGQACATLMKSFTLIFPGPFWRYRVSYGSCLEGFISFETGNSELLFSFDYPLMKLEEWNYAKLIIE